MVMAGLGSTLRIGDLTIGTDKFGHFFDTGHVYFQRAYRQGGGEEAGMMYGERTERGIYGIMTTGVFSYADLVANYNGMNFWKNLTDKYNEDPSKIYFKCEEGQWKQVRVFDWKDYVDAGWDEGINCSRFKTKLMTKNVAALIEKSTEGVEGESRTCPLQREKCEAIKVKYGEKSARLISPKCSDE